MNENTKRGHAAGSPRPLTEDDSRALAPRLPLLLWAAEPAGEPEFLSEQWATYCGIPFERLSEWRRELVHPEDRAALEQAWDDARMRGDELEARFRLRHASGEWRWQLWTAAPLSDGRGGVSRWVGAVTDVQAETALARDAGLLETISDCCRRATDEAQLMAEVADAVSRHLDVAHGLFADVDPTANAAHVRHDGHRGPDPLAGTHSLETLGCRGLAAGRADRTMVTSGAPRSAICVPFCIAGELRGVFIAQSSGPRVWTAREIALVEAAAGQAWLAIERLREAGGREAREAELTAARNEAERLRVVAETANRMKDEFLAVVSHELRAPLNAIGGWAGVLRVGKLDAAGIAKAATVIEKNVRSQAKMIEDLLDVSRIVSGKLRIEPRVFDPAVSVDGAIESLRPAAAAKEIRIEQLKSTDARAIAGDPNRLQQAVWNLISNAVKFTDAGGRVSVRLGQRDGMIEIAVTDTGVGIAPEFLPHVFKRFEQADRSNQRRFGGLGLGLAITRHIVELHGGTIGVSSAGVGQGATFTIRIPVLAESETEAPEVASAAVQPSGTQGHGSLAGLRLLSVDDEPDASEMLKAALEQYGATVTTVDSGAAALQLLEREAFDVLVSDIGMPGMNGYELLERVRAHDAPLNRIPAIAVTGYARSEDRERALQAGYEAHVVKPIEPAHLAATVRAAAEAAGTLQ